MTQDPQISAKSALQTIQQRYARIAEEILDRWGTDRLEPYIDSLLIDDRGNRSGFPPEVAQALLMLSSEHSRRYPPAASADPWHWTDPTTAKPR
ncbi:MAG TPA: hypothetical protein VKZ48_03555 [Burkholderiales bacterium]|nr:hypothetical protein [Burkholderiales bacterium]